MPKITEQIPIYFKPPIMCNKSCKTIKDTVAKDLELTECSDGVSRPIYDYLSNPSTSCSKKVMSFLPLYYTTDKKFLKDTQYILTRTEPLGSFQDYNHVVTMYDNIKNNTWFKDKYCFLDWEQLSHLNKIDWVMQFICMYNFSSPIVSLLFPVILLVLPFFVIKMQGNPISIDNYIVVLKQVIANHAIGKVFTQFNSVDTQQKIYLLISAGFYSYSMYQNMTICVRSYNNMHEIYGFLNKMSSYLTQTINDMQTFLQTCSVLPSYQLFCESLSKNMNYLSQISSKLSSIHGLDNFTMSLDSIKQIGTVMTQFYEFYDNMEHYQALVYSFGFNGYIDVLNGIKKNVTNGRLNFCKFSKSGKKRTSFKGAYYPALIERAPVKNSYNLKQDIVITGPNASGKTTILKSTLINVIMSQQFGCGCYSSATINPYSHIHCYLNIPDTMGRDSLLQAEARRCKEIIDSINTEPDDDTHLCVFDEIYSGTNPEEAIVSANAVMNYLANKPNVTTMLTTHYAELCKKLETNKNIVNCCMKIEIVDDLKSEVPRGPTPGGPTRRDFEYTYLLTKGISEVKGGIKVLIDMKYPEEILANACMFV